MKERSENPREESGVHRLAALLRSDATCALDGDRAEADWQRLLVAAREEDERALRRPRFGRLWLLAPLAACTLLVALGWFWGFSASSPLRFKLDGREPAGNYLASEDGRPRLVEFSDGSNLVLRSSGRLRVTSTHSRGATLSLERGRLEVSIRHHPSARWRLDVGPYVVEVTGTRFAVTWNPDAGEFGVDLLEGAVLISGPGISTPVRLQVGQQFRANKAGNYAVQGQPQIAPAAATALEPPARVSAAAASKGMRVASATGPEPAASPSAQDRPACDWAGFVSSGQFEATIYEARLLGNETALAECPIRGLFALADAARYLGKFDLSKSALMAVRQRAPDDRSKAAFFLGRLEEARGNLELAQSWYSQAMAGNADPQFAAEANAGKARITKRIRSVDSRPSHVAP
jgi:ferric-dicitrate binding protein FerR (iron transport regulator)